MTINLKNKIRTAAGVFTALAAMLMLTAACEKVTPDNPDPKPEPDRKSVV